MIITIIVIIILVIISFFFLGGGGEGGAVFRCGTSSVQYDQLSCQHSLSDSW